MPIRRPNPRPLMRKAPLLVFAMVGGAMLSACAHDDVMRKPPTQLTDEQVCLSHYEKDPVMKDRCHLSPEDRKGPPQDVDPHQLPLKTNDHD